MRWRQVVVLYLVLAALAGEYWFVERRREPRGVTEVAALPPFLRLDPATLRVGPGDVPYARVKGGRFEARFSRAAAHQLWGLAEHDEPTGRSVLRRGRREYTLRRSR